MTQREIRDVIADNPGKPLYIRHALYRGVSVHSPCSKSFLYKHARLIKRVRVLTYGQERPDLSNYGARISIWNTQIVTFDATSREDI